MSGKTPKTGPVRFGWASGHPRPNTTNIDERLAEFDRWLAAHDAEVLAAAGFRRPARDEGYHVELGDQRFTQAQWEAVQRYCEGRPAPGNRTERGEP